MYYSMPHDAEKRLQQLLDDYTADDRECGCQLVIYHCGEKVVDIVSGYRSMEKEQKVDRKTLFPVFSVGKGFMATAFLRLLAAGKASLEDAPCKYWHEFIGGGKENLQIWQLLSHRAGLYLLPRIESFSELADWESMCRCMESAKVSQSVGKMHYHAITFAWIIGELAKRIDGRDFRKIISEEVFAPLGIEEDVSYGVSAENEIRCAAIDSRFEDTDKWCGSFISDPAVRRGFIPSANCFATAGAIARHYAAMLFSWQGEKLLPESWIEKATIPRRDYQRDPLTPGSWVDFGLGYVLSGADGDKGSRFGHGGAAGAEGYADKKRQLALGFTKSTPFKDNNQCLRNAIAGILEVEPTIW
jgi:CubicO group peptidase (beta-lactamase class C family)